MLDFNQFWSKNSITLENLSLEKENQMIFLAKTKIGISYKK